MRLVRILALMLADDAEVEDHRLSITGGGGVCVRPPHLPETYEVHIAGYAIRSSDDPIAGPVEAQLFLDHPDQSGNQVAILHLGFEVLPDAGLDAPTSAAFAFKIKMNLFNEGVHHLTLLQDGRALQRLPFLVTLAD